MTQAVVRKTEVTIEPPQEPEQSQTVSYDTSGEKRTMSSILFRSNFLHPAGGDRFYWLTTCSIAYFNILIRSDQKPGFSDRFCIPTEIFDQKPGF